MNMADLIAFHCKAEVKAKYLKRVRAHRAADEIVRGTYWSKDGDGVFRGCAVGCTLHSGAHKDYETELGIPRVLAYLEDGIFEGLPKERALAWPEEFLASPQVGADLSLVWPKFAVWLLTDEEVGVMRFAKSDRARESIQAVAAAYSRVAVGEIVAEAEWRKLWNASYAASAAYASDASAAYAASAASDAAYAASAKIATAAAKPDKESVKWQARVAQADKLLDLMAAAPVAAEILVAV
jgi:hypothetical protein